MKVQELMSRNPEACTPEDSCAAALDIMKRRNCGFVPVVGSQKTQQLEGVLTDRDIALQLLEIDRPASKVSIRTCMKRQPKTVFPQADLEEAIQLMETAAIHRLPVAQEGKLVGVLSLKDIAAFAAYRNEEESEGTEPGDQQIGEVIEAIAVAR